MSHSSLEIALGVSQNNILSNHTSISCYIPPSVDANIIKDIDLNTGISRGNMGSAVLSPSNPNAQSQSPLVQ